MSEHQNEIAVIIPVYNSIATLQELIDRLTATLSQLSEDFEIILVDDCGPQPVWPVIERAGKQDPRVKGVRLSRNFGQHPSITAGLSVARARWYVVMDCDLQDKPEDIIKLYKHARENNCDSVIAHRDSHDTAEHRKLGSYIFNKLIVWLADIPASEAIGVFRIFNNNMAEAFRQYPEQMRIFHALMSNVGFSVDTVGVERPARSEGTSSYTLKKLVSLAFEAIIANSVKPLYFLLVGGFLIAFVSSLFGVSILMRKVFVGVPVEGWASLMTMLSFFSGIMIFTICLVGIYVGQVFFEVKRRPHFIIAQQKNITSR